MTAALPTEQAPGFHHRRFGDVFVTALLDGYADLPAAAYLGADAQEATRLQRLAFGPAQPRSAINGYLVRTAAKTILIDAGAGGGMGPNAGKLKQNLNAAGVGPEQIDHVVLTHLHGDHFGGTMLDDGSRAFPNADLTVAQAELDYWLDDARVAEDASRSKAVRQVTDAYRGKLHALEDRPHAELTPHPLPGHTPGHTGFMVGTGAERVLIWGDVFHLPALQVRRPEIGLRFDVDPAQAEATRRATLAMAASERLMVAGMHMDFPGFAYIDRTAGGYGLVWSAWAPAM